MTNTELIEQALQLINVLGEGEHASAEQGDLGLKVLNAMMADWEEEGVSLEYYEQDTLGDETPIPAHAVAGVRGYLAAALAPWYGKQLSDSFLATNRKFYERLVRNAVRDEIREADMSNMSQGSGNARYEPIF